MPKLPRGMFRRGKSFYVRLFKDGRDKWISLGSEYEEARRKLRWIRRGDVMTDHLTLTQAARQWLGTYLLNRRDQANWQMISRRTETRLLPMFGHVLIGRLTADHVEEYRAQLDELGYKATTVRHY